MCSGRAVQTKGLGSALVAARKRLIAACSSTSEPNVPRLSRRLVSLAKSPSTALSHEAAVGRGEVEGPAGMPLQPRHHLGMLMGAVVVQHGVDQLAGRDHRLNRVQDADE